MKPKNDLNEMVKKAKRIKDVQFICNTILANACYHEKQMEEQFAIAEKKGKMSMEERDLLELAWEYRNKTAKQLIDELKKYMEGISHESTATKQ
jgi:hypothetical protein